MQTHAEKQTRPETPRTSSVPSAPERQAVEPASPAFPGHAFARISVYDRPVSVQRQAADSDTETSPEAAATEGAYIVEDDVTELSPGQVRKSEFLTSLHEAMCRVAVAEAGG